MFIAKEREIKKVKGPILIIGAGGFIGYNILLKFLETRLDIYGIVKHKNSWRLKEFKEKSKLIVCDITNKEKVNKVFKKIKPQTIINCSAYGAYANQEDINRIYEVNFLSTVNILDILTKHNFSAYIHCGSSSEYGFNSSAPIESATLLPDSHYAVSKAAVSHLISYYGKKIKKPVIHLRLYSVYGPWEESSRLIPKIVEHGLKQKLPKLVASQISRDFIYIDDVFDAFVHLANNIKPQHWGETYNLGTGIKTTIKTLANLARVLYNIKKPIKFGSMKNRKWDLADWYANPKKIHRDFNWKYKIKLKDGLKLITAWQKSQSK